MNKITDNAFHIKERNILHKYLMVGKINISGVARRAATDGLNNIVLQDWLRGKGLLSDAKFLALKNAIDELNIEIKMVIALFDKNSKSEIGIEHFKKLLSHKEIKWFIVFGRDRFLHGKLDGWKMGRRVFPLEDVITIKSYLNIFLTETKV